MHCVAWDWALHDGYSAEDMESILSPQGILFRGVVDVSGVFGVVTALVLPLVKAKLSKSPKTPCESGE